MCSVALEFCSSCQFNSLSLHLHFLSPLFHFPQEVWYVVLESLHRMLLPMLQWDKEGVQAVSSDFPAHNYTNRQCTALETMLEILRVCIPEHTKNIYYACLDF